MRQFLTQNKRKIIIILIVFAILVTGYYVWWFMQFRLVSTTPDLSKFSNASPSLTLHFNDDIQSDGFSFRASDNFAENPVFSGKSIKFTLDNALVSSKRYVISFTVKNRSGSKELKKSMTFTAKNIAVDKLSKQQQDELMATQDRPVYAANQINYQNFDDLLNYGVTSGQLNNIKGRLYDYSNSINKQYWTMTMDTASVKNTIHDSQSEDPSDSVDFSVKLASSVVRVHADYRLIYDSVHLTVADPSGTLLYDSANAADPAPSQGE